MPWNWVQLATCHRMNRRPKAVVSSKPTMASANCAYPELRPASKEPLPGKARLLVRQPQAVWRLSGRRGPSAKETFIRVHQRTQSKRQVQQDHQHLNQDQGPVG